MNDIRNSQNYLHSQRLVSSLIANSDITTDDLLVEIGPGKGIITDALLERGCKVIAIEMDFSLSAALKDRYLDSEQISVVHADFLKFHLPSVKYKIFSNIPFNITAAIMNKLFTATTPPEDMYLIMQQEAFYKYAGEPFSANGLRSLMYKPWFKSEIIHHFQPTDFTPVPHARIVLARFQRRSTPDVQDKYKNEYFDFIAFIYLEPGENFSEKFKRLFSYEQQKRVKRNCSMSDMPISSWSYKQWLTLFEVYREIVSVERKQLVAGSSKRLLKQQSKVQKVHRNRARFS